jgi:hypothetical protein
MILTCNHCGRRIGRNTEQDDHRGCSHCAEFSDVRTAESERRPVQRKTVTSSPTNPYRQTA